MCRETSVRVRMSAHKSIKITYISEWLNDWHGRRNHHHFCHYVTWRNTSIKPLYRFSFGWQFGTHFAICRTHTHTYYLAQWHATSNALFRAAVSALCELYTRVILYFVRFYFNLMMGSYSENVRQKIYNKINRCTLNGNVRTREAECRRHCRRHRMVNRPITKLCGKFDPINCRVSSHAPHQYPISTHR